MVSRYVCVVFRNIKDLHASKRRFRLSSVNEFGTEFPELIELSIDCPRDVSSCNKRHINSTVDLVDQMPNLKSYNKYAFNYLYEIEVVM